MSSEVTVVWAMLVSKLPNCDIHKYVYGNSNVTAHYDGRTKDGPWANMCEDCFNKYGVGLGSGRGQKLILK